MHSKSLSNLVKLADSVPKTNRHPDLNCLFVHTPLFTLTKEDDNKLKHTHPSYVPGHFLFSKTSSPALHLPPDPT